MMKEREMIERDDDREKDDDREMMKEREMMMKEREMMMLAHLHMSENSSLRIVFHQPTLSSRYHMSGHLSI